MSKKIRVVLADDSAVARGLLRFILEQAGEFEIVGEAVNGKQAVTLAKEQHPDLITMDLEMPVMNGLDAIRDIMCSKAIPILVVSSVADAGNAYKAISLGALDVVSKPTTNPTDWEEFIARARMASKIRVITHLKCIANLPAPAATNAPPTVSLPQLEPTPRKVFVIACSTGGPQALASILPRLTPDFCCPILVAQHISDGFAAGMADWLNVLSAIPVKLASPGTAVTAGTVTLAPSEYHLRINKACQFEFLERSDGDIYHPSCDILLESVATVYREASVGMILTGMGRDGVKGMRAIYQSGGKTLAQDESSSVIFGMNRMAIDEGVVQQILPLDDLPEMMLRIAGDAS